MWSSWAVRQVRHNYLWKDIANTTDVENGIEVFQSDDAAFNNDTSYNGLYKDGAIPMWAINLMATCKLIKKIGEKKWKKLIKMRKAILY